MNFLKIPLALDPAATQTETPRARRFLLRGRRIFLKLAGSGMLMASLPSFIKAYFVNTLGVRTVEKGDFQFKDGLIYRKGQNTPQPYFFEIGGLVQNRAQLSYPDLLKLPQSTQTSDFHCVEGWSVKDLLWGGILFEEIVRIARPRPEAKYAIFHALGETLNAPKGQSHYLECLPVEYLLNRQNACLLALTMNGRPLLQDHGAPMRVIAPYDLGYKSIKFIYRVDFADEERPGWWTLANPIYPMKAPVPASRLRKK